MDGFFWLAVVAALGLGGWLVAKGGGRRRAKAGAWSRFAAPRRYLMTRSEAAFERELRDVLDRTGRSSWRIHAQVAMSALFDGAGPRPKDWRGPVVPPWCLDYVLTSKGRIVGIVELNDPSHRRRERRWRDENLQQGCRALGVPMVFVEGQGAAAAVEGWLGGLRPAGD